MDPFDIIAAMRCLRTEEEIRALSARYLGPASVCAVYGSQVTGRAVAASDVDVVFSGCDETLVRRLVEALYPDMRQDVICSEVVWVPAYAPYTPRQLGARDARVVTLGPDCPATAIRRSVDAPVEGVSTVEFPRHEGDLETPGLYHVRRALVYAARRGALVGPAGMQVEAGGSAVITSGGGYATRIYIRGVESTARARAEREDAAREAERWRRLCAELHAESAWCREAGNSRGYAYGTRG